MFPIRDHNPSQRTPFVTIGLIIANTLVFLLMWPYLSDQRALFDIYAGYALIPARLSFDPAAWPTLLTSAFMHGGLLHLTGNMLFLWIFGDNLEDQLGHVRYLAFYLLSAVAAGMAQYIAGPDSVVPMVGASGAVAGVMGAYLLLFPRARVDVFFFFVVFFRIFAIPAWIVLGVWFGLNLLDGSEANVDDGGVAYWAHAGGFVAGFVLILPFWLRRGGPAFWAGGHGRPPHPEAEYRIRRTTIPRVRRR